MIKPPVGEPKEPPPKVTCNCLRVPEKTCYLTFKADEVHESEDLGFTNRGEQLIVDYDKEGRIIGIELLDSPDAEKPCMTDHEE